MSALVLSLLLGSSVPVRLPPVEQCGGDPAFDRFRARLEWAVRDRDSQKLSSLMAPDVRIRPAVQRVEAPGAWPEAVWAEMARVLRLGCATARDGKEIRFRAWPAMFVTGSALDGYATWVSLPGARLTGTRSLRSTGRVLPPWSVLTELETNETTTPFRQVKTASGARGFVREDRVRSLIDYRLIAKLVDGQWKITAFYAGD